ncbi:disease resistance protein RPV1-like [Macadamia integrifolia]|uniref:disease resistance protein RPV1-like n=1 Tax=Macadamia integrifolia TaxID=60698 RepID=UPI001C4F0317|nr:disease resistance protein RPV1-like [Macadamia integrifolia]
MSLFFIVLSLIVQFQSFEVFFICFGLQGTGETQGIILDFEDHKKSSESKRPSKVSNQNSIAWLKKNFKNAFNFRGEEDKDQIKMCTKMFRPMLNLRLLQINHVNLEGDFKHLPANLKWLQWKGCPLEALPSDFCPRKLAVIDLSESKIKQVQFKMAKELQVMNLLGCFNLTATPDFSGHPKLEKLILERCLKLKEVHKSVGDLSMLRLLNLKDCRSLEDFPNDISGLRNLETLNLSCCLKLKQLPEDLMPIMSLKELLVDQTAIVKLPDSIFHLKKVERLSLKDCRSLKQLPISIGELVSLRELHLDGSALEELPDSIGLLKNLEILNLMRCKSITAIPDSIGNLRSLLRLFLDGSAIKELPDSIGSLSDLKHLYLSRCRSLCKLPASIGRLMSMVELHLDFTPIRELPNEIGKLNMLEKLQMIDCTSLACLPLSIGYMSNLTTLVLENGIITELPESICLLEKLKVLRVTNCKQLSQLPESIGKLKNLCWLRMEETGVAVLPEEFGGLSSLMILRMEKGPHPELPKNTECTELTALNLKYGGSHKLLVLPSSFSNLSLLRELYASSCKISWIPDDFEKLSSLEILNLRHNNFCSLPSSLSGLSVLKKLLLSHCTELKSLPLLPSSLVNLDVRNCTSLESIFDLSNLEKLEDLHLTNCNKVVDVPGLECLKSLERLYMSGCTKCHPVIKRRFSKVALKHMRYLSFPGSEIPDWFVQETVRFSSRKNHKIKAVIIGVVISLDQQIQDDNRNKLIDIVDIQANLLRDNTLGPMYKHTMKLLGVPKTDEDQVYLLRYPNSHPLTLLLHDGDKIQVTMRDPTWFKGLTLKKYGIHLIFEDDDDYDGDEESLTESQQSVSEKLARFFSSL